MRILKQVKATLIFLVQLAIMYDCEAATYECTAVDKKATVASNQSVSVTSDANAKTCSFSVAGASSGKQPGEAASILQRLRQGQDVFSGNNRERELASLLLATAPNAISQLDFGNKVRNRMNDLEQCVRAFREGNDRGFRDNFGGLSCSVLRPTGRAQGAGALVSAEEPMLELAFRHDRQIHQVFVPASFFGR